MTNEQKAKLIHLAAQMARLNSMPDPNEWPWSARASNMLWRAAMEASDKADEQCRLWAVAIREIVDSDEMCQIKEAEILAAYARRRLKRAAQELAKEAQTK